MNQPITNRKTNQPTNTSINQPTNQPTDPSNHAHPSVDSVHWFVPRYYQLIARVSKTSSRGRARTGKVGGEDAAEGKWREAEGGRAWGEGQISAVRAIG